MLNEMADLGDVMIGTTPPLMMRVIADPTKPRSLIGNTPGKSTVEFTIGDIEFHCGGQRIDDPKEQNLAFYFLLHASWPDEEPRAQIENGRLVSVEFTKAPEEHDPHQGFAMVGYLSSMISNAYADATTQEGEVTRLSPAHEPGALGILIDREYKGSRLPLWRFTQKPSY